jgi:cytochrome oxidase assembly protein ShyY1
MFKTALHRSGNKGFVLIAVTVVLIVVVVFGSFSIIKLNENIRETQQAVAKVKQEAQRAQQIADQINHQTDAYKDTAIDTIKTLGGIFLALFVLGYILVKLVKICKRG